MHKKVVDFNLSQRKEGVEFKAGDVVKVYRKIKEGDKERTQIFEGMVIAVKGGQSSSPTITVRKVSSGVGVEIIVPVFSPSISKIEIVKRAKVRRAKLYYVREKVAKALRFKFSNVSEEKKTVEVKAKPVVSEKEDDSKENEEAKK